MIVGCFLVVVFLSVDTAFGQGHADHGLVGLRPLPRTAKMDHSHNHGGSWAGTPTYEEQKGNYPFVATNLDVVKDWLDGDFKTKDCKGSAHIGFQLCAHCPAGGLFLLPFLLFEGAKRVLEVAAHEGIYSRACSNGPGRAVPNGIMADDGFHFVVGHVSKKIPRLIVLCSMYLAEPAEFIECLR